MLTLENPEELHINTLPPHAWFIPYADPQKPIPDFPSTSSRVITLIGQWLKYAKTYAKLLIK